VGAYRNTSKVKEGIVSGVLGLPSRSLLNQVFVYITLSLSGDRVPGPEW
jgi:hypothetical protein